MQLLKDRRILFALIGAALALAAGLGVALNLVAGGRGEKTPPPPASRAGLVVETGPADDAKLDPARPLRCFVAGQYVGEMTLADCAQRNGVATGALDVGLDEAGNLAAADQAGMMLVPLPPEEAAPVEPLAPAEPAPDTVAPEHPALMADGQVGACWRYAGGWRRTPGDVTLAGCVQALYAGKCERQGGASYGRWMQQTLRLVAGRVEISSDNRTFRPLADQGPGCQFQPIG